MFQVEEAAAHPREGLPIFFLPLTLLGASPVIRKRKGVLSAFILFVWKQQPEGIDSPRVIINTIKKLGSVLSTCINSEPDYYFILIICSHTCS
jgi:hypothetical protein